jgi:DNA modification methylase
VIRFLHGDCRDVLKTLPDGSVHTVVTSPPYYGLRDYGTGRWSGGDAGCNHVVGEIRTGLGLAKLGERYAGGGHKASEPKPMTAKGECPKCGAVRVDSQIGLEATPDAYIAELVAVFREVWRVLRDDGTFWLNIGDSYNAYNGNRGASKSLSASINDAIPILPKGAGLTEPTLKNKDILMIPARLAIALQADGWYLRSDIIWNKPNPMPESCTDRPTSSHEHIFLLAKSGDTTFWTHRDKPGTRNRPEPDYRWVSRLGDEAERSTPPDHWPAPGAKRDWSRINLWKAHDYFWDAEAVREACESGPSDIRKMTESLPRIGGKHKTLDDLLSKASAATNIGRKRSVGDPSGRNLRNVWTIATAPYRESHFATFPPSLVERCVKAGTSEKGCCPSCGAPWVRVTERIDQGYDGSRYGERAVAASGGAKTGGTCMSTLGSSNGKLTGKTATIGWHPTCDCPSVDPVPCTVLDPFSGSGTTALVADRLGRDAIGIDLSDAYGDMAKDRLVKDAGLFADIR